MFATHYVLSGDQVDVSVEQVERVELYGEHHFNSREFARAFVEISELMDEILGD